MTDWIANLPYNYKSEKCRNGTSCTRGYKCNYRHKGDIYERISDTDVVYVKKGSIELMRLNSEWERYDESRFNDYTSIAKSERKRDNNSHKQFSRNLDTLWKHSSLSSSTWRASETKEELKPIKKQEEIPKESLDISFTIYPTSDKKLINFFVEYFVNQADCSFSDDDLCIMNSIELCLKVFGNDWERCKDALRKSIRYMVMTTPQGIEFTVYTTDKEFSQATELLREEISNVSNTTNTEHSDDLDITEIGEVLEEPDKNDEEFRLEKNEIDYDPYLEPASIFTFGRDDMRYSISEENKQLLRDVFRAKFLPERKQKLLQDYKLSYVGSETISNATDKTYLFDKHIGNAMESVSSLTGTGPRVLISQDKVTKKWKLTSNTDSPDNKAGHEFYFMIRTTIVNGLVGPIVVAGEESKALDFHPLPESCALDIPSLVTRVEIVFVSIQKLPAIVIPESKQCITVSCAEDPSITCSVRLDTFRACIGKTYEPNCLPGRDLAPWMDIFNLYDKPSLESELHIEHFKLLQYLPNATAPSGEIDWIMEIAQRNMLNSLGNSLPHESPANEWCARQYALRVYDHLISQDSVYSDLIFKAIAFI